MDEKFFVCIYICNKDVESELINDELAYFSICTIFNN